MPYIHYPPTNVVYWYYPMEDPNSFETKKWDSLSSYLRRRDNNFRDSLATHRMAVRNKDPILYTKLREQIQQFNGWRRRVARRTFTIEIKLDIDEGIEGNQAYEAMLMITKQYARDILASAVLINDGRKQPAIAMFTEDSFHTQSEIELLSPSERDDAGNTTL